ncbi:MULTISPECIES: maleylpyruvate isomerase family mycothiol-dependent enzyme [unclassified Pseudofrankia]|uniref:maleylpyruvate isomerase family mycothiol-dependent enzyme n=1 Tax=unclassified Pseudofrankia TaxID=2994372 RepID=UPI0008DB28BF|nr:MULTISPECIES: maleylpyruvate isomerase family mycothiol-dependent enzyme [unclassified Pseudofrankia]MDT3444728.1 maleylpyruvate isomerase family mycothiol-dependent enzyme [Pseudofrankia sp. BMG5.37]OHV50345.1 wyosine base formation [Pseudofrankia sp. BMG5.36]
MRIFDDLEAELDDLDRILGGLDQASWAAPSAAAGWSVADVVLHLAQTDETVVETIAAGPAGALRSVGGVDETTSVDEAMDAWVSRERADPTQVYARWRAARTAALEVLRRADPDTPVTWVAAPLRPAALATTRLTEHWAHGLDITEPLAIPFPDTDRLRHVAWLAHRTLPYAFASAGERAPAVRCELTAPDGVTRWEYGPADAACVVSGPAGAFCRVAARRLAPESSGLVTHGPDAPRVLDLLRTYAL